MADLCHRFLPLSSSVGTQPSLQQVRQGPQDKSKQHSVEQQQHQRPVFGYSQGETFPVSTPAASGEAAELTPQALIELPTSNQHLNRFAHHQQRADSTHHKEPCCPEVLTGLSRAVFFLLSDQSGSPKEAKAPAKRREQSGPGKV